MENNVKGDILVKKDLVSEECLALMHQRGLDVDLALLDSQEMDVPALVLVIAKIHLVIPVLVV